MAKKERLEDIDVMQGIDFKGNRVKRQKEMAYKEEQIEKLQQENTDLKKDLKILWIVIIVLLSIIGLAISESYNKEQQARCEVNHSRKYCIKKLR